MTLQATGAFAAVINGALQVAQAVRDQFATRTNAVNSRRLALEQQINTTPTGIPWNGDLIADYVDLKTLLTPGTPSEYASGFRGIVFNGRDIFLVPSGNLFALNAYPAQDIFVSYNTTFTAFTSAASYQTVSLTSFSGMAQAKGFGGAALDANGMLYMVPFGGNYPSTSGQVVRFDTSRLLSDASAYATFGVGTISGSPCTGYGGACFDGRFLYLSPSVHSASLGSLSPSVTPHGFVVRYDTTQSFTNASTSWTAYNLATALAGSPSWFQGCITDGQWVYFIPYNGSLLAAFQIGQTLAAASSWTTFDLSTLLAVGQAAQAKYFGGASLVGRYLFLIPFGNATPTGTKNSILMRYDTLDPRLVTSAAAWQTIDLTAVTSNVNACGYQGALTDGAYLYLVPALNNSQTTQVPPFLRYDTTQALSDTNAWSTIGGTTTTPSALKLQAAFAASDGIYGYLGPNWSPTTTPNAYGTSSGGFYRWRLWPGPSDAQAGRLGQSLNFWLDSSGRTGFGTKQPAEQIHASANIRADGLLLSQMGASGMTAPAQTTPYVTANPLSGSGSPFTLAQYALPANALSVTNKGVRIRSFGGYSATTDSMFVLLNFGSTQLISSGQIATGGTWYLEATALLSNQGTPNQACGAMLLSTPLIAGGTPTAVTAYTVAAQAISSTITIAVQGSAPHTADVTLGGFSVDFIN
jgi:hypothetical protein